MWYWWHSTPSLQLKYLPTGLTGVWEFVASLPWRSLNKKTNQTNKSYHIWKECKEFLDIRKIMLGEEVVGKHFKRRSSDFKNLAILAHYGKALCKIIYMLIFSCTSFRSASLDVEPIYTFRAHKWVFPEKHCHILRNRWFLNRHRIFLKSNFHLVRKWWLVMLLVPMLFKISAYVHLLSA